MEKNSEINKYILIINFIKANKNRSSLKLIRNHLSKYANDISRSTFMRYKDRILELFGINIEFDATTNSYFITDSNEFEDNIQHRMLDTLNTFNILQARDLLVDYVQFEVRKLRGTEHFHDLLTAIKNKKMVKFSYFNFHNQQTRVIRLHPLYLKEARNRWYVIGCEDGTEHIQAIGLDRISELEITKKHRIQPKTFSLNEQYKYCMGASDLPKLKPEKVRLSFGKFQGQYLKTYPLHHTQKVTETDNEIIIELEIKLTPDFIMEMLSYGDTLRVIAPQKLTDELIKTHEHSIKVLKGESNAYLIAKEY